MRNLFLILLLLSAALRVAAQDSSTLVVHKDPRLDQLVKKTIEINEYNTREARRFVPGFRILIINTNDRNKANEAKARLYRNFPDVKSYLVYQSPFYKLKAGNYLNQKEAEDALNRLQVVFPANLYIVRDVIEVNPDKSGELEKQ